MLKDFLKIFEHYDYLSEKLILFLKILQVGLSALHLFTLPQLFTTNPDQCLGNQTTCGDHG